MKITRNRGLMLLSIWLIVSALIPLLKLHFAGQGVVLQIVAIAAGVLILLDR